MVLLVIRCPPEVWIQVANSYTLHPFKRSELVFFKCFKGHWSLEHYTYIVIAVFVFWIHFTLWAVDTEKHFNKVVLNTWWSSTPDRHLMNDILWLFLIRMGKKHSKLSCVQQQPFESWCQGVIKWFSTGLQRKGLFTWMCEQMGDGSVKMQVLSTKSKTLQCIFFISLL